MNKYKLLWYLRLLRLWWSRLYIRKDEFHSSLSFDAGTYLGMNEKQRGEYVFDIVKRRSVAHQRDEERELAECRMLKKGG